jgi:hypothetical protein
MLQLQGWCGGGGRGGGGGDGGGGDQDTKRTPQSAQSKPSLQWSNSAPSPPSSHVPSRTYENVP